MTAQERREAIVEHLRSTETAAVDAFASMFDVSRMTVHRDLDALVEQRLVRKVRGGATLLPSVVFEGDYDYRAKQHPGEKGALGRAAAQLVEPGMAIALDDSSTVAAMLPFLMDKRPLTVITNASPIIRTVERAEGITLLALGGVYDRTVAAYTGLTTERAMRSLRVDLAFMSTACVRASTAYMRDTEEVVRVKLVMMEMADESVLLVDHNKFARTALIRFVDLSAFDRVLVTDGIDRRSREVLRRDKVRLEIVRCRSDGVPVRERLDPLHDPGLQDQGSEDHVR
ncbi:MAG: DeoR/GlpR family DNA-binding transcription regulator [Acuticoccus sp.]